MENEITMKQLKQLTNNFEIKNKSAYYQFGWRYFGPFLYGFSLWLNEQLQKKDIHKVFFFSRDGYMMKKAFELLEFDRMYEMEYVYFSRKSLRQALLYKTDQYQDSLQYLGWEKYVTLAKLLEYYGFSKAECIQLTEKYKWDLQKEYDYDNLKKNQEVERIYDVLKPAIVSKSSQQRALMLDYLKQIDMQGQSAIVDIGWQGSMQYCLEQFLSDNDLNAVIHGYYIGISPQYPIAGTCNGYLYNPDEMRLRKSILCFFGIMEKLFQSCEGSTDGYERQNEKIRPVQCAYEYEDEKPLIHAIQEWQTGAVDFIKKIKKYKVRDLDYIQLAMPLIRVGKNPSLKEVNLFSSFYNTDGVKEYYVSQKGLLQYKPKELMHALSNSVWKTGFMKSVFKIPFPYFCIYRVFRK